MSYDHLKPRPSFCFFFFFLVGQSSLGAKSFLFHLQERVFILSAFPHVSNMWRNPWCLSLLFTPPHTTSSASLAGLTQFSIFPLRKIQHKLNEFSPRNSNFEVAHCTWRHIKMIYATFCLLRKKYCSLHLRWNFQGS